MSKMEEKWIATREAIVWLRDKKASLEATSIHFHIPRSTLHWRIHHWCKRYDRILYDEVVPMLYDRQTEWLRSYYEKKKG